MTSARRDPGQPATTRILPTGTAGRGFVAALGIGQVCSWGTLYYSFPQIAEAMGAEFGWSRPQLYGAATVGLILSGVAAFPVGAAIDRGHGRIVMSVASVLAGMLLIAWSRIDGIVGFYAVFAGIGCLHAATLYEPAFAVVSRRVGAANARQAITALTLWGGFASTVFIPLIQLLLDGVGWRTTLVALGMVNLVLCPVLYGTAIRPARDAGPAPGRVERRDGRALGHVARMLRRPVFWALAVFYVVQAALVSAFGFHMYPLFLEKGLGAGGVVAVIAIIGPSQVAGRIVIAVLARRASIAAIGTFTAAAALAAFVGLAVAPGAFAALAALAALYGATNGVMTIVRGLAVPELLTTEAYGAINGVLAAPSMVLRALAPVGAALLWQTSGDYGPVTVAFAAAALLMGLGFWTAAALGRRPGNG